MTIDGGKALPDGHIRPLDPFRDLDSVVELINVAFGGRLDPTGEATLARMRRLARSGPMLKLVWALLGRATVAPGLVWVMDGRPVGNVSVRRARGREGYLIGNVVVHPAQRGQGIASALMRQAIRVISRRGAPWVGLEVRADNDRARRLYERLGFEEVGRTRHLLRDAGEVHVGPSGRPTAMRRGQPSDADELIHLMMAVVPEAQRPLLEVEAADYHLGWRRRIQHWLRGEDEIWWVIDERGGIAGAVRTLRKWGAFPNRMEILVQPEASDRFEEDLVKRGVARLGRVARKPIETTVPDAPTALLAALEREGFRELRVLVQMKRSLGRKVSVSVS